ncbi:MAG: ribonuclease Y [Candidatus Marinimicrobia bacterium]|nr:ribonuclease Y [bacterium]MCG2716026.1 ribonuclease Y [Candidatus Neomarinimicrobiota bacterium]
MSLINIVIGIVGVASGAALALFFYIQNLKRTQSTVSELIRSAKKQSEDILRESRLEAKDEAIRIKHRAEDESRNKMREVRENEKKLLKREFYIERKMEVADKKSEDLDKREIEIKRHQNQLYQKESEIKEIIEKQTERLERIAGLSRKEAQDILMENLMEQAKTGVSKKVKEMRDKAISEATRESKKIIVSAIQRSAADHTAETTVSVVNLPNDSMKGRIIGREGRNIRHFESLTGVEIVVDDTPEVVVLSGFDPVRREIARVALEKLLLDGRIHPARIEEMIKKATIEIDESILRAAEEAINEVNLSPFQPELMKILGNLKYRTSYGQNVLQHSIEVAWLSGLMAAELGLNGEIAKRAGLLHDIGKAIDRNITGTHALIGVDLAKKFKENEIIINAIGSHHEEIEAIHPISVLVAAADQISGSRRGARGDTLESYIQRLVKLEEIAISFDGVSKTYAIQAGREVRVIVENELVDDSEADNLSEEIAAKIQNDLNYPGQIKVVVIREHRSVSYAK